MPRTALNQEEIDAYRGRLLAAAEHLVAVRGYQAVTLRALAAELGCSPMTPYRYFNGIEEIFALVRASAFSRFAMLQDRASREGSGPAQRLRALGVAYLGFATEEPDAYRVIFALDQDGEQNYPELLEAAASAWAPMRRTVGEAVDAGLFEGDPDTLAHLLWAGLHGIATLELAHRLVLGRSLQQLVEPMMQIMMRGAGPAEENSR